MEILERGPVLVDLSRLLHEAGEGAGRLVFLGGEAGIGKTAVVRRFREMVKPTARILLGACDPLSTPRPLAPLLDLAEQLGREEWRDLMESVGQRDRLFRSVLGELSAGTTPSLVVLEDVHWADDATCDLLRFLGRRIETTRSLLIATYRDDEVGDRHRLRIVLGDLATSPAVARLHLQRLSVEAVDRLSAASGLDPRALHRQTGGNPFFVSEVLAAGGGGIPATVRDAVLARASRLPDAGRTVLDAAAVIGARVSPRLLETVTPESGEGIEACLHGGMLIVQDEMLTFRHELVREALLGVLSPQRKTELHRAILEAIRANPVTATDLARLAHHAEGAGDAEATLEFAPEAGRRAAALNAHREAAAQYGRALRFGDRLPPAERLALLEAYAREAGMSDQIPAAIRATRELIETARAEGDPRRQGAGLNLLGRYLSEVGRNPEATEANEAAIQVLEGIPPSPQLARAYASRAGLHMIHRENAKAVEWATRALGLAEGEGDVDTRIAALNYLGSALVQEGDDRGRAELERSLKLAKAAGRHQLAGIAYVNLGCIASENFEFDRAERYLHEGLEYASTYDLVTTQGYIRAWTAITRLHLGAWDEAERLARQVLARPEGAAISRIMSGVALGRCQARRGDPAAGATLDAALDLTLPTGTLLRVGSVRVARAEHAWLSGDTERVREEASATLDLALHQRHPWLAGEMLSWLSRVAGIQEPPDWIARPYALQVAGAWTAAAAEWRRLRCPYEAALSLIESGSPGERGSAIEELERLGASAALQRIGSSAAAAPGRAVRRSTQTNPAGLTARERDVVRLLAEGLQNAEIAKRLFLSPKTVDHHVSAILAKLRVRTRTEAARLAGRIGLLEDGEPEIPK